MPILSVGGQRGSQQKWDRIIQPLSIRCLLLMSVKRDWHVRLSVSPADPIHTILKSNISFLLLGSPVETLKQDSSC